MRATWNGVTIAESDHTVLVEGNHYFPPESVNYEYLRPTWMKSLCPWKGLASYHAVVAGDQVNVNAAWTSHASSTTAASTPGCHRLNAWRP